MKLLNVSDIKQGIENATDPDGNVIYPHKQIAKSMKEIIYQLNLLDADIVHGITLSIGWICKTDVTQEKVIETINIISKEVDNINQAMSFKDHQSEHYDDYHWWRFARFCHAMNSYFQLGLNISERPSETERLRINSACDFGKRLFDNS